VQKDPLSAKRHVAYVSENVTLYGNFSAHQNLVFFGKLAGRRDVSDEELRALFARVGLPERAYHRRVRGFSKGMRQRLGIAIAILKNAELIVLDEPTSGLDPEGGFAFLKILESLKAEGRAILMSSHDIFRVKSIADKTGIMRAGRLLQILPRQELQGKDLETVYLEYMRERPAASTEVL
jgi:ABC-2 type transport system ATP-binding protein